MKTTKRLLISAIAFLPIVSFAFTAQGDKDSVKTKTIDLSTIVLKDDPFMVRLDSLMVMNFFTDDAVAQSGTEDFAVTVPDSALPKAIDWHDTVYEERIRQLNEATPMNLTYNPTVRAFIDLYAKRRRTQLSKMLGLAEYYFPMFEAKLDQYNMPLELKYLAVVESALNPIARSRVGATGLWQFMYSTGRLQGLEVNSYVDDRTDPIKSTQAACEYLTKLYNIFDDWDLALAAYNSGPGNVSKAIRRSGGKKTYWEIRPYLPRETASYVPAFIAVNYIMNHHEDHLIYPAEIKPSFFNVDTIKVKERLSFAQIQELIDIEEDELLFLNPSYKNKIIPKAESNPYVLVLPANKMGLFVTHEDSIYSLARKDFEQNKVEQKAVVATNDRVRHKVRRGEVLGTIAERYGVRVSSLRRWNGLRGNTIRVGQYLTVYPRNGASTATQTASAKKPTPKGSGKDAVVTYRVRNGDTFYSIARRYPGISAQNIMGWNNYSSSKRLKVGARLKIYPNRG